MKADVKLKIIPAVKGFKDLEKAVSTPSDMLFLLKGELIQLRTMADYARSQKKKLIIHLDLIDGIQDGEAAVHFLAKDIRADGIISTRKTSLAWGKKYGLTTIQRGFLLDSQSLVTILKTANEVKPDYIELLPSFAYPIIQEIRSEVSAKLILGGFVDRLQPDWDKVREAGVIGVSTTNKEAWFW